MLIYCQPQRSQIVCSIIKYQNIYSRQNTNNDQNISFPIGQFDYSKHPIELNGIALLMDKRFKVNRSVKQMPKNIKILVNNKL